jgi:tetratricopeptide (TPR) repeat protein
MRKQLSVLSPLATTLSSNQQDELTPKKIALVIGNGSYTKITRLNNPVNDADDITDVLVELGFTVDKVLDGDRIQMEEAITRHKQRLSETQNTYGFFYYAGHGVQYNMINYLLPVNIDIPSENYLGERSVSIQALLGELADAGNELNIIVLDACRNNPFSFSRSSNRGLSPINAIPGSIIIYSTNANRSADDGIGRNGLFTSQLLLNLSLPGLSVMDIFNKTGKEVRRISNGEQHPEIFSCYYESAYLRVIPVNDSEQITQANNYIQAKIHFDRGVEYDYYRDDDSAIAEFTEAIRLDPNYTAAYNNRGIAYGKKGNFDYAIADFDQALKLNPILAEAFNNRGNVYNKMGDYDRAIADLNQAIHLKPDDEEGYCSRGDAYRLKGDYARAIMDFDKAIMLNPKLSGAYNNRGIAYRDKGDHEQAIFNFEKAIQLNPELLEAYNNRGTVYFDKGNYDKAISDYNRAISYNNPILAELYYNRGMAYGMKGDLDRAILDYEMVIQINPNDNRAYNNLGHAHYTKGDYNKAIENYEDALRIDPNYILARNNLEQARRAQGRRKNI